MKRVKSDENPHTEDQGPHKYLGSRSGQVRTHTLQNGDSVNLVLKILPGGVVYFETPQGYSVQWDEGNNAYYYLERKDGKLINGQKYNPSEPPPKNIPKHLRAPGKILKKTMTESRMELKPKLLAPTIDHIPGLGRGLKNFEGNVFGVLILVEFKDIRFGTGFRDDVVKLISSPSPINGNSNSVKGYLREVSGGKFSYDLDVIGPVRLSQNRNFYDQLNSNNKIWTFIDEAVQKSINDPFYALKLSKYAANGVVVAMNFGYAGGQPPTNNHSLWPHNWVYQGNSPWHNPNQARIELYQMTNLGISRSDLTIGTLVHENCHMLFRFPDLYDTDYSSSGLGPYCLMAAGSHLGAGKYPCGPSAFLRERAGWFDKDGLIELKGKSGIIEIEHGYRKCYKYTISSDEFFMLEARLRRGNDLFLPAEGLAVYHCDTTRLNNDTETHHRTQHYLCALIQADGLRQLESGPHEDGDPRDLYVVDGILSDDTTPAAKSWDGKPSGLKVKVISVDRERGVIQVSLGNNAPPTTNQPKQIVAKSELNSETIPDAYREGIRNTIQISQSGKCISAKISVSIKHSFAGDLSVTLISPINAQKRILQPTSSINSPFKDIVDLDVSDAFRNSEISGFWVLNVADYYNEDEGTLNNWSITLEYA